MQPIKIRTPQKPRRNPLVLAVRQRQAGPYRDQRRKAEEKLYAKEMRKSMNQRRRAQEAGTDE